MWGRDAPSMWIITVYTSDQQLKRLSCDGSSLIKVPVVEELGMEIISVYHHHRHP